MTSLDDDTVLLPRPTRNRSSRACLERVRDVCSQSDTLTITDPSLCTSRHTHYCTVRQSLATFNHGRRSRGDRGDKSPRIWSAGTLIQIAPPQILSYRYKNERSVAFKIRQNPFSAGAGLRPGPRWGSSRRSPRPLSRLERGHPVTPPHLPSHSTRTHLRRSPCVPPEVQPDLRLCFQQHSSSSETSQPSDAVGSDTVVAF